MSSHPDFKTLEASRPPFEATTFRYVQAPEPDWKPGQGANGVPYPLAGWKTLNPDDVPEKRDIYKLMMGAISPRPIALVSTISEEGVHNLAPFSFFAPIGSDPHIAKAILVNNDFVVNIISESFLEAAHYTAIDSPPDVSEWQLAGLTPIPSDVVKPPRVAESPFAMECFLEHVYEQHNDVGQVSRTVVFGRVKRFHWRADLTGEGSLAIDLAKLRPVSRLGGIGYGRTIEGIEIPRWSWDAEKDMDEVKAVLYEDGKEADESEE